jgi:hypothetical protein
MWKCRLFPLPVAGYCMVSVLTMAVLFVAGRPLAADPLTVVELFTSQGCSSCPPADALIGELAGRGDLLVLSEHVDYWDYLGWKDPFASPLHTARQRDYARALGLKYVYTPQIVVHGEAQVTGTDRAQVLQAIATAARPQLAIDLAWQLSADQLVIRLGTQRGAKPADVWLVLFDRVRTTRIASGENIGRKLINHHVVREFRRVGQWFGTPVELTISLPAYDRSEVGCAIVVQVMDGGPVLGATRCASPSG